MDQRQRKIEKKRKKRKLAKRKAKAETAPGTGSSAAIVEAAARSPFGPCALSRGWDRDDDRPDLVIAVVTHLLPDGRLLPSLAAVDRTCLGVKSAFVARPMGTAEFGRFLSSMGSAQGGMDACEVLVVQSVVYHAIDYARRLGFEPHRDFPESLFGPRPARLLDTPFCAPEKPYYVSGPDDDVPLIMSRLDAAVGPGTYDFLAHVGSAGAPSDADGETLLDLVCEGDDDDGNWDDGEVSNGGDDGSAGQASEALDESPILVDEIARLLRRCERGESVVMGLGDFILFSSATGDAWLLDALADHALNLARDGARADVRIVEDDSRIAIEWKGAYAIRGPDFITDALPGGTRTIRGYPTDDIRRTIDRLRQAAASGRSPKR